MGGLKEGLVLHCAAGSSATSAPYRPAPPPKRSAAWLAVSELGEEYDAVRDRFRGLRNQGLTAVMVFGDYFRRRITPL